MSYIADAFNEQVISLLKEGGIGLMPTDTIYGLSAMALDKAAVERIHKLKQRDSHKPLIVLISDIQMLNVLSISPAQAKPVKKYWPGALSLEFQAGGSPRWLNRGGKTFAIRLPDYPKLRQLIRQVGPIVSTSANLQGEEPIESVAQAQKVFGNRLDFYVDAGKLHNPPSTLVVVRNGNLEVVRQGAVKI